MILSFQYFKHWKKYFNSKMLCIMLIIISFFSLDNFYWKKEFSPRESETLSRLPCGPISSGLWFPFWGIPLIVTEQDPSGPSWDKPFPCILCFSSSLFFFFFIPFYGRVYSIVCIYHRFFFCCCCFFVFFFYFFFKILFYF